VICEEKDTDYTNPFSPPGSAPDAPLAAFFRHDLFVADVAYNKPPVISSGVDGNDKPIEWTTETYTVTATDPDADPLTYAWTLIDGNGDPVDGYDGVAGDGAGSLDIDWGAVAGWTQGVTPYSIDCVVSDAKFDVSATTLDVGVWVQGDLWVSNNTAFDATPDNGTQAEPFSTINQALAVYTTGQKIIVDYGTGTYNEQIYQYYAIGNVTIRAWSWYTTPAGRPKLTYNGSAPIYIYYTPYVTIRGFKVSPYAGSTANQLVYAYYSPNISFYDCYFTGQLDYYYYYVMYLYYCDNITVKNCLFGDLATNYPAYTYAYMYFYFYRGNGQHNVSQNEFTKFQETPQVSGYMYTYLYCYYWPAGSKFTNNLFHHLSPNVLNYGSLYIPRIYYPYANVTVANNTIDKYDMDKGSDVTSSYIYGMYLYNGGSVTYGYDANSNIVSNMNGTKTNPYYYGIYAYNTSTDYDDVYNIQDTPYGSAPAGPNSISADPQYVNNTSEPYDYHLATGSPCIGTGKGGVDMGCYGNLPAGETVVGLLTAK